MDRSQVVDRLVTAIEEVLGQDEHFDDVAWELATGLAEHADDEEEVAGVADEITQAAFVAYARGVIARSNGETCVTCDRPATEFDGLCAECARIGDEYLGNVPNQRGGSE